MQVSQYLIFTTAPLTSTSLMRGMEFVQDQHLQFHQSLLVLEDVHCGELCQDLVQRLGGEELNPETSYMLEFNLIETQHYL